MFSIKSENFETIIFFEKPEAFIAVFFGAIVGILWKKLLGPQFENI